MSEAVCQGCLDRDAVIADLLQKVGTLTARVAELEARLNQNSSNSSTPPSADPLDAPKRPPKKATGKKRGAQPGHAPFIRIRLPAERVTKVVCHRPTACECCNAALPHDPQPGDPEPSWHQVVNLPEVRANVIEHQGHYRVCPGCEHVNHAAIPAEVKSHSVGADLAALLAYLRSLKVSLRGIEELVESVFEVPISIGTVSRLEQEMSAALAAAHAEALAHVRGATVKHVDETSWKRNGKLCWLWAAATLSVAAFVIHDKRGRAGFEALLGVDVVGILVSDRWSVYGMLPVGRRQVCWSHLKRDFKKCEALGGEAEVVGGKGLNAVKEVFEAWHLFRGGGCDRPALQEKLVEIGGRLKEALQRGREHALAKAATFCGNLLDLWPALWAFGEHAGVEPTNNHAERVLRRGVLWRKCSFGSRSEGGSVFVSRMLTAVQTLRLQGRPVLPWLVATLKAHREGLPAPSLLPTG